jgi:hypothetical protein
VDLRFYADAATAGVLKMNEDYFKTLTPRQQLNDLMHKYAQANNGDYPGAWKELDRRWKIKHGNALSWLQWKHNQNNQTTLTIPAYLEAVGKLDQAITLAIKMKEEI